jgi:hypothetical protein
VLGHGHISSGGGRQARFARRLDRELACVHGPDPDARSSYPSRSLQHNGQ